KKCAQVKVFVTHTKVEPSCKIGMWIANHGFIVRINPTISIDILTNILADPVSWHQPFIVADTKRQHRHTGTVSRTSLIITDSCLAIIKANDVISIKLRDGASFFGQAYRSKSRISTPKAATVYIIKFDDPVFIR